MRASAAKAGEPSRVICVSSAGMLTERLELEDPEMRRGTFDGTRQYAKNKRAQVAMCEAWAEREKMSKRTKTTKTKTRVTFFSQHPAGATRRRCARHFPGFTNPSRGACGRPGRARTR